MALSDRDLLALSTAFSRVVANGRAEGWIHAYLVESESPEAAIFFARALGLAINCTSATEGQPACGTCESCRRASLGGMAPLVDVWPVGLGITIGQVQSVIERCAFKHGPGVNKVFLFHTAERMQHPAANALLKTLEEPPERTVLILDTGSPDQILPTIRSRCRHVRLALPDDGSLLDAFRVPQQSRDRMRLALDVVGRQPQVLFDLTRKDAIEQASEPTRGLEGLPAFVDEALRSYRKSEDALTPVHALLAGGRYGLALAFAMAESIERLAADPTRYRALSAAVPLGGIHRALEEKAEKAATSKLKELVEEHGSRFKHPLLAGEGKVSLGVSRDHVGLVLRAFATLLRRALRQRLDPDSRGLPALAGLASLPVESLDLLARRVESLRRYARQNVSPDYLFDELFLGLADVQSGRTGPGDPLATAAGASGTMAAVLPTHEQEVA